MAFPQTRLRRLRYHPRLRDLVREHRVTVDDLIMGLFVRSGQNERRPIHSMPGHFQISPDLIVRECQRLADLGVPAVLLFGIPDRKDDIGSAAWDDDGLIQRTVRAIKAALADRLLVITDLCFCEYTSHGHCGPITDKTGRPDVDNDAALANLARQAVSHARAGADVIAPSGMMDGMVRAVRSGLDAAGFSHVPILSYAAKYASALYAPFREAADSAPQFGDRRTYQMDPANGDEALREVALDLEEGADLVMVKPAMTYMDILWRVKERFGVPVCAYQVSGEFAMLKAAADQGWIDERRVVMEVLTGLKRAGADMIVTYYAGQVAEWLRG